MSNVTKFLLFSLLYSTSAGAEMDHSSMHHQKMIAATDHQLVKAGNDIFAAVQEVIVKLNNNPDTDWSKVNLEAFRQHLLDMNDMAINVEVIKQKPLSNGLEVTIQAITARAEKTLQRVFKAHPMHLKRETGWTMSVVRNNKQFIVTTTSEVPEQANKIIALSYIGLMANGNHHQPHHWAMSTGQNPHAKHH